MNYFDLYSSYPDHTITAAWESQIKEANNARLIAERLHQRDNELFARFAACYAELRGLPRGTRRILQRQLARSSELAAVFPEYRKHGGRRLQHRMAWSLAGAALLLALTQGVGAAATITVTTSNPNIIADGQCSLIEATINANNDAATHADCAAGGGPDTIVLPGNANLTLTNRLDVGYGLPLVTSRITIEGNGAVIARQESAPDAFGLIAIHNAGDLTLQNLTLSGGLWGGIRNEGILTIEHSTISGNKSVEGGGVSNFGTSTIKNSTLSNNTSIYDGGGVNNHGTLAIRNSVLSNNLTYYFGGGVGNENGTLTIENSTISENTALGGGGIINFSGSVTITNSTISGNVATGDVGGGLLNTGYVHHGSLTLKHNLIAGNQATGAPEISNFGIVTANNFNIFGSTGKAGVDGFTPGPTDIVPNVSLAQILGPLADNGGSIQTHALISASPAIDAGDPGGCRDGQGKLLLADQRGFARHVDGNNDTTIRCDIGAFEFGAEFVPVPPGPLAIAATTLATGEAEASFTSDLKITGGVAPYLVSITSGRLPAGLTLGNDGIISGTISPTARSEKFTVRIADSLNDSVTQTFTIPVIKAIRITEIAKAGRVGRDYRATFKTKRGRGPFSWSITAGALPPGLNFNTSTGAITGTPTQAGEFPLTVQVTDALGGVDVEHLNLRIK